MLYKKRKEEAIVQCDECLTIFACFYKINFI